MKSKSTRWIILFFIVIGTVGLISSGAQAEPPLATDSSMKGHGKMMRPPGHSKTSKKGYAGHGAKMHLYAEDWSDTLTDKQKKLSDQLHVKLKTDTVSLKAQIDLKKTDLNLLIIQDKADMEAINRTIDETLDIKRELMRIKAAHKIEMRDILTEAQRISFDMGLLKKKKY